MGFPAELLRDRAIPWTFVGAPVLALVALTHVVPAGPAFWTGSMPRAHARGRAWRRRYEEEIGALLDDAPFTPAVA